MPQIDRMQIVNDVQHVYGDPAHTLNGVFTFTLNLLSVLLQMGDEVGLCKAPQGGSSVVPWKDGWVRCNRVVYSDGQIYKIQTDTPNGNLAWNDDGIDSSLYVPVTLADLGYHPVPSTPGTPTDPVPAPSNPAPAVCLYAAGDISAVRAQIEELRTQVVSRLTTLEAEMRTMQTMQQTRFPNYSGEIQLPFVGSKRFTIKPDPQ